MLYISLQKKHLYEIVLLFPFFLGVNLICAIMPVLLVERPLIDTNGLLSASIPILIAILSILFVWKIKHSYWSVPHQPPAIVRSLFCLVAFVPLAPSLTFHVKSVWFLKILLMLYLGQLVYERLEFLIGGYLLLAWKALNWWLRRIQRRKVKRLDMPPGASVMVVDVGAWYSIDSTLLAKIKRNFPKHIIVDNVNAIDPANYPAIDIIFGAPPKSELKKFTSLRWLHLPSSGMNGYELPSHYIGSPIVTNSAGVYGVPISEYALGLIIMLLKRIDSAVISNKCGYGNDVQHATMDLCNSTVLVVGLGNIGKCIAQRCRTLGARVLGVNRTVHGECPEVDQCFGIDQLKEVVGEADIIALALPESPDTDNLINKSSIRLMKRGVCIVNVGRGNVVNQRDLCQALRQKWVGGAALDVSVPDPLWPNSKLYKYRNLVLTLHHSSVSSANGIRAVDVFLETSKKVIKSFV